MALEATVLVPTSGARRDYLTDTVRSVQTKNADVDFEIVIVDNGSAYDIAQYLKEQGFAETEKLRVVKEPRMGLVYARHAGAKAARSEILVYIDDDVLVPEGWLRAYLDAFKNEKAGCVGGKVLPQYEGPVPDWLGHFSGDYLSLLNHGDAAKRLDPPHDVWGCNMAVRKKALFDSGGFNPDGFADPKKVWFRGDGECGLQTKIRNLGYDVYYEPGAWLYHRIPASRLVPQYFYRRLFTQGIDDSFKETRQAAKTHFLLNSLVYFTWSAAKYTSSLLKRSYKVKVRAEACYWAAKARHQFRMMVDPELRRHVFQKNYF